ncbi:hypothetical protein ES703_90271 [subsurface metagenome]
MIGYSLSACPVILHPVGKQSGFAHTSFGSEHKELIGIILYIPIKFIKITGPSDETFAVYKDKLLLLVYFFLKLVPVIHFFVRRKALFYCLNKIP